MYPLLKREEEVELATADEDGTLPETGGVGGEGSQDPAEGGDEGEQGAPAPAQNTIVELAAAVTAGDLAGALSGAGPLTVFAPTNAAFAAVPEAEKNENVTAYLRSAWNKNTGSRSGLGS